MSLLPEDATRIKKSLTQLPDKDRSMKKHNLSENDDPDEVYSNDDRSESSSMDEDEDETDDADEGILKRPTEFLENFTAMYGGPLKANTKARCMIMPSAKWKLVWDFWVVFLLLAVSLIVPYRLAFDPVDSTGWLIVYYSIDSCFVIDMLFTFLTATIDTNTQVVQTDKKEIARQYFGFWFWIDLISVLPLDAF